MEVDKVQATHWCEDYSGEEEHDWTGDEEADVEIDYVGELRRRCGGMGHYTRECPTQKGKGKGKSKGKKVQLERRWKRVREGQRKRVWGRLLDMLGKRSPIK